MSINKELLLDLETGDSVVIDFLKKHPKVLERLNNRYDNDKILKEVWDYSPCTISCVDRNLNYKKVNPKILELIGGKEPDLLGQKIGKNSQDNAFLSWIEDFNNSDREMDSISIDTSVNHEKKSFYTIAKKINNDNDILIIGMDITSLKELQENTVFNEKMISLGEMSASIIHEINNPMTSIMLNLELMEMGIDSGDVNIMNKTLDHINDMVSLINKIIKSLKSFSRNGVEDNSSQIMVKESVDQVLLILGGKIKKTATNIITDIPDKFSISFNETEFLQVLINLVNNSMDAISDDDERWVKISAWNEDSVLNIEVSDSGNGIDDKISNKIFDKFYSTKDIGKGTGLGLNIVKQIVERNKGDIFLNKESENTAFKMRFKEDV